MTQLATTISGFVVGDDLEIRRTVTDLPSAIATAWLTVKRYAAQADTAAVLQKKITVANVPGTGQIVAAGGIGIPGDLRFDLAAADTTALGARQHVHDIQIKLSNGKVYTVEKGTIELTPGVTAGTT